MFIGFRKVLQILLFLNFPGLREERIILVAGLHMVVKFEKKNYFAVSLNYMKKFSRNLTSVTV